VTKRKVDQVKKEPKWGGGEKQADASGGGGRLEKGPKQIPKNGSDSEQNKKNVVDKEERKEQGV